MIGYVSEMRWIRITVWHLRTWQVYWAYRILISACRTILARRVCYLLLLLLLLSSSLSFYFAPHNITYGILTAAASERRVSWEYSQRTWYAEVKSVHALTTGEELNIALTLDLWQCWDESDVGSQQGSCLRAIAQINKRLVLFSVRLFRLMKANQLRITESIDARHAYF